MLTEKDKTFIADCTADLIVSSGQTGKRYVPDTTAERIYGTDNAPFVLDCEFPFEYVTTPFEILTSSERRTRRFPFCRDRRSARATGSIAAA